MTSYRSWRKKPPAERRIVQCGHRPEPQLELAVGLLRRLAQRLRDFVPSRRAGAVQQIKTNIDFHTYGELVLWPYGYTTANTAPGLAADAQQAFATLGNRRDGHRYHRGGLA